MSCGSPPPRRWVAVAAHAKPNDRSSSPDRLLLFRDNRNDTTSVPRAKLGDGFGCSIKSYGGYVRHRDALQDRDRPEYLVIDVDVRVGPRGSFVEARLSTVGEEVRPQRTDKLVSGCGERADNL